MLDKRNLTCRLHVLTLLDQQMLHNNVRTCSWGLKANFRKLMLLLLQAGLVQKCFEGVGGEGGYLLIC